jgi:hypothetical protein
VLLSVILPSEFFRYAELAGESLSGAQIENALTYLSCTDCIDASDKGYTIEQVLRGLVSPK